MLEELHTASALLKVAVDRYLDACLAVAKIHRPGVGFRGFSEIIMNELEELALYETKVIHSKSSLRKVRNHRIDIVPINTLPSEILARIFLLASPLEHCFIRNGIAFSDYPSGPPESLLQVCSYWRSIVLDTHSLWAHIDLAPHHIFDKGYLACGRLFASQAGRLPLTIHIDLRWLAIDLPFELDWLETCISLAGRAKGIEITIGDSIGTRALSIVEKVLKSSVPGKLVHFTLMDSQGPYSQGFLIAEGLEQSRNDENHEDAESIGGDGIGEAAGVTDIEENAANDNDMDEDSDTESGVDNWHLDVPCRHLEELLLGVTVLRLNALYLPWSSQAYHGLVKLHLSGETNEFITISQLGGILRASPQLAFFYFSKAITVDCTPELMRLDHLEVLHLDLDHFESHENVLRLILPGSKPLRISAYFRYDGIQSLLEGEYRRLFTSSNVVQLDLWFQQRGWFLYLFDLLDLVPRLETLSLYSFQVQLGYKPTHPLASARSLPDFRLARLYLVDSTVDPKVIEWVNDRYPVTKMMVSNDTLCTEIEEHNEDRWAGVNNERWRGEELAEKYPAVTSAILVRLPGQIENWSC